jgi:hypothetical protein
MQSGIMFQFPDDTIVDLVNANWSALPGPVQWLVTLGGEVLVSHESWRGGGSGSWRRQGKVACWVVRKCRSSDTKERERFLVTWSGWLL